MMDAQSYVQLKLGLILCCCEAHTVVHAAGWGNTKQQWTVLVIVTAVYSVFVESLRFMLYYATVKVHLEENCLALWEKAVPFAGKQIVFPAAYFPYLASLCSTPNYSCCVCDCGTTLCRLLSHMVISRWRIHNFHKQTVMVLQNIN